VTDTNYPSPDYTVRFYSPSEVTVKNSAGTTNKVYMDGRQPSGFTKSKVNTETNTSVADTPAYRKEIIVNSFYDVFDKSEGDIDLWF